MYKKILRLLQIVFVFLTLLLTREVVGQIPPETSVVENLGPNINSSEYEYIPVLSPDGNTLFFSKREKSNDINRLSNFDDNVWYSELQADGTWGKAQRMGAPINTTNDDNVYSITPDGNNILIGNFNNIASKTNGSAIMKKIDGKWGLPVKMKIHGFESNDNISQGYSFADNGKILLMSFKARDSKTKDKGDIYVSFLQTDHSWSTPLNIGKDINTAEAEGTPFLASDGVTLYFSSDGFEGWGGLDIFMSKRSDSTWQHWSEPINLGPSVNSSGNEAYYVISPKNDYAYFTYRKVGIAPLKKERASYGQADIYRISLKEKTIPIINVEGHVFNKENTTPVKAKVTVTISGDSINETTASALSSQGVYVVSLQAGKTYTVHTEAEGYYDQYTALDLSQYTENADYLLDFYLVNLVINKPIRIHNIYFETSSSVLLPESFKALDSLVTLFRDNPNLSISITGHTDNVGNEPSNLTLSDGRARSVLEYLVKQGVDEKRISSKGFGSTMPLDTNKTAEGRQQNRRVEFTVIRK
jgi:OOP family OmpA-OmpF porin